MKHLFDDLLEIYQRYEARLDELSDKDVFDLDELSEVIVKILAPESVGEAMNLPGRNLQMTGLIYLIEKDARGEYETGNYVATVICGSFHWPGPDVIEALTPAQYGFNGLDLCRWIDEKYPVEAITRKELICD